MRPFPPPNAPQGKHEERRSAFDWLTKFVVPILSLVMAALEQRPGLAVAFLGFAALVVLSQSITPTVEQLGRWTRRRQDRLAGRDLMPEFERLAERFAEFVSPQRNDTLHHVVDNDVYPREPDKRARLALPHIRLLETACRHFLNSVEHSSSDPTIIAQRHSEFTDLVVDYDAYCIRPVFESFPVDLRGTLTPEARAALESFRGKYVSFRERLEEFEKRAGALLTTVQIRPLYFDRTKPLQYP